MSIPSESWSFDPSWDQPQPQQGHGEYNFTTQNTDLSSHPFETTNLGTSSHGATGFSGSLPTQQFMPNSQQTIGHYAQYTSGGEPGLQQQTLYDVQPQGPSSSFFPHQSQHHDATPRVRQPAHATNSALHVNPPRAQSFELASSFVSSPDGPMFQTSPPSANSAFSFNTASAPESDRNRQRRPSPSPSRRGNALPHASKRQRSTDSDDEGAGNAPVDEAPQMKRACVRCKGLKVRCEFRDDQDSCERCMRGPHECVIPGKKVRRPPPKRADLLSQIQKQAAQIAELMTKLETVQSADRHPRAPQGVSSPTSNSQHSPVDSTNISVNSATSPSSSLSNQGPPEINQQSLEWITQARKKLEAFGGLIGMGGGNMRRDVFVESDPEDSSSDDDEYGIAVNVTGEDDGPEKPMSSVPTEASPFGLMAALAVKATRGRRASSVISSDHGDIYVANEDFFRPIPGPDLTGLSLDGHEPPQLLKKGIITIDEAEKLFNIYFDWMNISLSLLDPVLYTAQQVYWRSPFLFTVICAIASRYYDERPDLYPTAIEYARQEAGASFIGGQKRVEVVQAYILLSLYPVPARRWDEDRCWIYLGQAIRMALDMNLHHPNTAKAQNEAHAREMLNRTRAWLNCVNLDRSMGSQYGKPAVIRNTDFVAVQSGTWWNSSEYNMEHFDVHISAYNAELRVMYDFIGAVFSDPRHPAGLNKDIDLEQLATETDDKVENLRRQWFSIFERSDMSNVQNRFRVGLLKLAYSYSRLVALSYGFQHAFGKRDAEDNPFLTRCIRAASDVISAMVDDIGVPSQRIYVRHGPMAQMVFVSFAATFLIKLLQPKYARYVSPGLRETIISQVQRTADFLGSPEIAIDDRHGPKLYSRFINSLLAKVKEQRANSASTSSSPRQLNHRKSSRKLHKSPTTSEQAQLAPSSAPMPVSMSSNQPSPHSNPHTFGPLPPHTQYQAYGGSTYDPYGQDVNSYANMGSSTMMNQGLTTSGGFEPTNQLGMSMDWFPQPLPFDTELLQSMQSAFPDLDHTVMPGYAWMGQMPSLGGQQQSSTLAGGVQY